MTNQSRMKARALVVALLLAVALPLTSRAHAGDPPCPPGQSPDPTGLACVFVDKVTTGVTAATTDPAAQDPWLTRALELQHHLGDSLLLRDAMWVGTHNSFNTASNDPSSPSNNDSNQHLSLVEQLDIGIRGIEVDVHWAPSVWAGGAKAPVVCHARPPSELNAGCTYERLLDDELAPVAAWLDSHPDDVILLYLEDNIDEAAGYDAAATAIATSLGDRVYRPAQGDACPDLPLDTLRRSDVLAARKQVVIMSGCGGNSGTASWSTTVFDDSVRAEEGNPDFDGYPACTSGSVHADAYGNALVRFYEDSTFVSAAVGGGDPGHRLTVDTIDAMVRCGVNLFGLDQVDPNDDRLAAMVWSWASGEPVTDEPGTCAVDGADGRFHTTACDGSKLHFACVGASGQWFVSKTTGPSRRGANACTGGSFAVPRNGAQAERLREAKAAAGVDTVWLAYRTVNSGWSVSQ